MWPKSVHVVKVFCDPAINPHQSWLISQDCSQGVDEPATIEANLTRIKFELPRIKTAKSRVGEDHTALVLLGSWPQEGKAGNFVLGADGHCHKGGHRRQGNLWFVSLFKAACDHRLTLRTPFPRHFCFALVCFFDRVVDPTFARTHFVAPHDCRLNWRRWNHIAGRGGQEFGAQKLFLKM